MIYNFCFFAIFYFFYLFQRICDWMLVHFYDKYFKILVRYFNIWFMSVLVLVYCLSHSGVIFWGSWYDGWFFYYYNILDILAFNLVILFRFTIWIMLYFCELIFQWQFNFQSFFGVIVLSPSSTGPCWCCLFGRRCYLSWDVWCFLVGEENLRLTGPKILSWHFFFLLMF